MSLREQNKQRAKSQILQAAATLFAEKGVEDTTTREIARLAGVSYQTLYNYFSSKTLLIRELLIEELGAWSRTAEQVVQNYDGDLIASLLKVAEMGVDMLLGPKADLWGALTKRVLEKNFDPEEMSRLTTIAHEHSYAILDMAKGMSHLREDTDLHLMAHTLFCLADYNLLMFHLMPMDKAQFMTTQRKQFELIIKPYLI